MNSSYLSKARLLVTLAFCSVLSASAQVTSAELETRDGIMYVIGSESPFSGDVVDPGTLTGSVIEGLRDGEWLRSYPSGEPGQLMVFEAGVLQRRVSWHENGIESSALAYRDGRPHGPMVHRDEKGVVRERHVYEMGQLEGLEEMFDHKGQLMLTTEYVAGVRHGARIWWYDDDHKRWETHFEDGKRSGTWIQYTFEGGVFMESSWENDALIARVNPHRGH